MNRALVSWFTFLTVWLWITWREFRVLTRRLWLAAILRLGNLAIAAYVLLAFRQEGGLDGLFRARTSHV
jgi:hypothetical protein